MLIFFSSSSKVYSIFFILLFIFSKFRIFWHPIFLSYAFGSSNLLPYDFEGGSWKRDHRLFALGRWSSFIEDSLRWKGVSANEGKVSGGSV